MKKMRRNYLILFLFYGVTIAAQNNVSFRERFEQFKKQQRVEYEDFRQKANKEYAEFMRKAWVWYQADPGFPLPLRPDPPLPAPAPPKGKESQNIPEKLLPYETVIPAPPIIDQPKPIAPVEKVPKTDEVFHFKVYGTDMKVRFANDMRFSLKNTYESEVANQWIKLSEPKYNNLLHDCLLLRSQYNLCDWAYLNVLERLAEEILGKQTSEAVLLQTFLFNQSGYKVRLGRSETNRLYMMVASRHQIYRMKCFIIEGDCFYPLHCKESGLYIYESAYPKEQQMSLDVGKEQLFAVSETKRRTLKSKGECGVEATAVFNKNLIDFYNNYPQSSINNDGTTKWVFYANTPLSRNVRNRIYPVLKAAIAGKTQRDAANVLINFVQTALVYGYDDEIWGGDRPFFADETLYYPYSDCEDRAILFSRLIRDLLHLEAVLLYYPGHLAMAVCFQESVGGKTFLIRGKKFTYCEPTCTGFAPVGWCPKDLEAIQPKIVLLN